MFILKPRCPWPHAISCETQTHTLHINPIYHVRLQAAVLRIFGLKMAVFKMELAVAWSKEGAHALNPIS